MKQTLDTVAAIRWLAGVSVALMFSTSSTDALAQSLSDLKPPRSPLVLKQQGSFFVGGRTVVSPALGWDSAGFPGSFPTSGDVTVDQMYVQFQIPVSKRRHVPVVFVHGCCLSSKTWETTPDGRMG